MTRDCGNEDDAHAHPAWEALDNILVTWAGRHVEVVGSARAKRSCGELVERAYSDEDMPGEAARYPADMMELLFLMDTSVRLP